MARKLIVRENKGNLRRTPTPHAEDGADAIFFRKLSWTRITYHGPEFQAAYHVPDFYTIMDPSNTHVKYFSLPVRQTIIKTKP